MYYLTSIANNSNNNGGVGDSGSDDVPRGAVIVSANDQVVIWNCVSNVEPDNKKVSTPYYLRTGIVFPTQFQPVEQTFLPLLPVTVEEQLAFISSGLDFLLKEYGLVDNFYFHCTTDVFENTAYREYTYYLFAVTDNGDSFPASTSLDFSDALNFKKLLLLRDYDVSGVPNWYVRGVVQDVMNKLNFGFDFISNNNIELDIIETQKQFCILSSSGMNVDRQVRTLLELIRDLVFMGKLPSSTPVLNLALTFANEDYTTPYSNFLFKNRTTFNLYTRGEVFAVVNELSRYATWPSIANELTIYRVGLIFAVVFESYYYPDIARVHDTKRFIGVKTQYVEQADNQWITFDHDQVLFSPGIKQTLLERLSADKYPYIKQVVNALYPNGGYSLPSEQSNKYKQRQQQQEQQQEVIAATAA